MALSNLTESQLEARLSFLERQMSTRGVRDPKSMPHITQTYQLVMDELVRRDLEKAGVLVWAVNQQSIAVKSKSASARLRKA